MFKKNNIKAGEVVEYEIDINADVSTKKLPHTDVIKETVKNVVNVGNHIFNITVRYDVEVEDNVQSIMQVIKTNVTNPTLDQLIDKKEMSTEERLKEAEAKAKQEAEKNGLPEVTAAELADPAVNGLTDHARKMKVALAKKFGIINFSMFRAGDDDGTGHGHGTGMSVDFIVPVGSAQGDQLAEYLTKNMNELGVYYIIWKQRFYMPQYNIYDPANTWNLMPDCGGATANHYDHVHVSFVK